MENKFHNAVMILTEDCNLRCTYCYEKGQNYKTLYMTEKVAKDSIDFLMNEVINDDTKDFHITFFGGEPTLNISIMDYIFDYSMEYAKKYNLKPSYQLITNCTIFNNKIYSFIEKWYKTLNKVNIQLSIDGHPNVQDSHRINKNGDGSSKLVEKTVFEYLKCFEELGIPKEDLVVHGVITNKNVDMLYESYKYIKSLGIVTTWFMPVHEALWDSDTIKLYEKNLKKIANEIFVECKNSKNLDAYNFSYTSLSNCRNHKPDAPCSAGKSLYAISPTGDLYPCHRFYFYSEKTKIGDIYNGINQSKIKIYQDYDLNNLIGDISCSQCSNNACKICIAANYEVNKNIFIGFKDYCKISKIEDRIRQELKKKLENIGMLKLENKKFNFNEENLISVIKSIEDYFGEVNEKINIVDNKVNLLFDLFEQLALIMKESQK